MMRITDTLTPVGCVNYPLAFMLTSSPIFLCEHTSNLRRKVQQSAFFPFKGFFGWYSDNKQLLFLRVFDMQPCSRT